MKLTSLSIGISVGLALTGAILIFSSFTGQDPAVRYISMKAYEYPAMYDSRIIIVYETGQIEEIPLEKGKPSNAALNMQKITETMNMLSKKGYRLASGTGDVNFGSYIFEKK